MTIKTGFMDSDGCEEELMEYICDYPNCPNIATQVLGYLRGLRLVTVVCDVHGSKARA